MPRSGRASLAITRQVIAVYGDTCHLCGRPGATTRDHIIPYSHGGTDDLANLRPAHRSCNSRRGNKALNGHGMHIHVVIGPPAAGKTTYVAEHAKGIGDIVIDLDVIARALMPVMLDDRTHVYPKHTRHVAIGARAAAIDRATRLTTGTHLWIIHAIPSADDMDTYRMLRYDIITIDPGRPIVEARVRNDRPTWMHQGVAKWYATWGKTDTTDTTDPRELVPALAEADW